MTQDHEIILDKLEQCRVKCCECFSNHQEEIRRLEDKVKELKYREALKQGNI